MKNFYIVIAIFLFSFIEAYAQPLDARATIKTTGLNAEAFIQAETAVNFPNGSNVVAINLALSIPANGETNPANAPAPVSVTTPVSGLSVNTTIPVEIWNDRFVYTYLVLGNAPMMAAWAPMSENKVLNVLFPAPVSGDFPRLDNLLNEGIGGGNNGQSYFYFDINGTQRSDTEGDPFYNGVEGSYGSGDQYVQSTSALPIKLISFNAEKQGERSALITWTTADELNSSHFLVQRSVDKKSWTTVGRVNAAGNSQLILNYEFVDFNVYNGIDSRLSVYYRLQMIDLDNYFQYSTLKSVVFGNSNTSGREFLVYPNPASDGIQVEWDSQRDVQPTSLEFYDVTGKLVYVQKIADNSNQEYIDFHYSNVKSGLYLLRIMNGAEAIDHKQIVVGQNR